MNSHNADRAAIALLKENSEVCALAGAHMIISKAEAEHYKWGDDCDGWILASGSDLLVIEEQMPAKTGSDAGECRILR